MRAQPILFSAPVAFMAPPLQLGVLLGGENQPDTHDLTTFDFTSLNQPMTEAEIRSDLEMLGVQDV